MALNLTTVYKTGTVSSVSDTMLNTANTAFDANDVGRFVRMVDGPAMGQTRLIMAANTTTLTLHTPWTTPTVQGVPEVNPVAGNRWVISYKLDDIDDGVNLIKRSASTYEFVGTGHLIGGGGGTTATFVADTQKSITLDSNAITLSAFGALQFGRPSADGTYSAQGCNIIDTANGSNIYNGFGPGENGDVQLYGCSVVTASGDTCFWRQQRLSGVCRLVDTQVTGMWGCRFAGAKSAARGLTLLNQNAGVNITTLGTVGLVERLTVKNSLAAFYWHPAMGSVEVSGIKFRDLSVGLLYISGAYFASNPPVLFFVVKDIDLNDIDALPTYVRRSGSVNATSITVRLQQRLVVSYVTPQGAPILSPRITVIDSSGAVVVDETPASGVSTPAYVRVHEHTNVQGAAAKDFAFAEGTSYRNLTVRARQYRYHFTEVPWDGRQSRELSLIGVPNTVITLSEADALALTGLSVDFDTQTLTVSGSRTLSEIYDWAHATLCQTPNLGRAAFISCADGTNFTLGFDLVLEGEIAGPGALSMASNALTVNSGVSSVPINHAAGTYTLINVTGHTAGARMQVYNLSAGVELYNDIPLSATLLVPINWTADQAIRVRMARVDGLDADLPIEAVATLTSAGVGFLLSPAPDVVYNQNAIDGATVTEFSPDYVNVQVDVADGDGATSAQRLYAWMAYNTTVPAGIDAYFNAVVADDAANYRINQSIIDLHIQNAGSNAVVIGGARLYRADGSSIFVPGTGPIQSDPGKAFIAADIRQVVESTNTMVAAL